MNLGVFQKEMETMALTTTGRLKTVEDAPLKLAFAGQFAHSLQLSLRCLVLCSAMSHATSLPEPSRLLSLEHSTQIRRLKPGSFPVLQGAANPTSLTTPAFLSGPQAVLLFSVYRPGSDGGRGEICSRSQYYDVPELEFSPGL